MPDFSEEGLDHYLLNQVDLRHRTVSRRVEEVLTVLRDLTTEVSKKDGRFQSIAHAGVNNENIKDQPAMVSKWAALLRGRCSFNPAIQVLTSSLVLVSVPVRGLIGYHQHVARQWRYYSLTGSILPTPVREPEKLHQWLELESFTSPAQDWQDAKVCVEGDIVPAKVVSLFREQLETAILTCSFSANAGKVSILESVGSVVRVAIETVEGVMEAELVPTVELINYWPKKARWPRLLQRWPTTERARCIKSFGFNLMATSNYHWLLSFSRAEQALLVAVDEDGGCRRKCYRVVRQLKEDTWCPGTKPVITAFHLQTLLFWCCEKFPCGRDWRCVKECVLRVARKLLKCVSQRYLRHYFVRSYNLLKYSNTTELDHTAQKINDFIANPSLYVH
ncbi:protein mab-21-like 3 isoform X1 [Oncorhynchus nerka]|uniref:protein mab-21-like 3 isoform X1 n=1 Tax=Oncorhynchus nerka TaxID=8023 RepID=UPI001131E4AB|nr:protein mab-21-like 3 isoform X1 [Oncorhynchus nerka]